MGGYGSGAWYRWNTKARVSDCLSLEASRLQQAGLFKSDVPPGSVATATWNNSAGDSRSEIGIEVGGADVTLKYHFSSGDGESQDISELVQLDWTPCNYGGRRAWFLCPGVEKDGRCNRRVAKLYLRGRYFLCRHCHGLAYASQKVAVVDRHLTRAQKIRMRLGGSANMLERFPNRPNGMHWKTYWKLWDKEDCENAAHLGIMRKSLDRMAYAINRGA